MANAPASAQAAWAALLQWVEELTPAGRAATLAELASRGVVALSIFDCVIDFILLDAFDDMQVGWGRRWEGSGAALLMQHPSAPVAAAARVDQGRGVVQVDAHVRQGHGAAAAGVARRSAPSPTPDASLRRHTRG